VGYLFDSHFAAWHNEFAKIMEKIAIIGIGGRTGAMFARELQPGNFVLGIGRESEVEGIKKGNLFLSVDGKTPEIFEAEMIKDYEFERNPAPDAIFLCTKNPITPVVKYYYQIIKNRGGKIPALFISQNGISAGEEAKEALKDVFGSEAESVRVVRISLFNPVDREVDGEKVYLKYSLPIRLSFGIISGSFGLGEINRVFEKTGIQAEEISPENVKNMEFSKLFLNLIGMASASHGLSVTQGFKDRKVFEEEIMMLREYIAAVHASGGGFLNFSHYPVKLLSSLFNILPVGILSIFRNCLGGIIGKGRKGKAKDLDEIEYYNGSVVGLGKKVGLPTPINQKIVDSVSLIKNNK